jgi:hypothetical protein
VTPAEILWSSLKDKKWSGDEMKGKPGSLVALGGLLKMRAGAMSALALIALAALCSCTLAQEKTAEDWYRKGLELMTNGSLEESVQAFSQTAHPAASSGACSRRS